LPWPTRPTNTVSVFLGKKDGTFRPLTAFSTGAATAPSAIATADFNGDGKVDLAVVLNGANTVEIFTGKGDGTFNSGVSFAVGTGPGGPGRRRFHGFAPKLCLLLRNICHK
jgi:hypothetical protein